MKSMKLSRWTLVLAVLGTAFFTACGGDSAEADAAQPEDASETSILTSLKETFFGKTFQLPAGTEIHVRLDHAVSSAVNSSGDLFLATLDRDLRAEGRLLAPAGSQMTGLLTDVEGSKRVKGRAHLTMKLTSLTIDGSEYSIETHPINVQAQGTKKKDAAIIGGSTAVGAVVGALTGGGKGAAVGAGVGAGGGTGFVLATKGEEVEFASETHLKFVLSESLDLPDAGEGPIT